MAFMSNLDEPFRPVELASLRALLTTCTRALAPQRPPPPPAASLELLQFLTVATFSLADAGQPARVRAR
jgi:hypothetical protein